jgi:hypothetical protein
MNDQLGAATLATAPTAAPVRRRSSQDRWFFSGIAAVAALAVFVGFAPTYFLKAAGAPALSSLLHAHGFAFTSWIVLLVVQTMLVSARRTDLHRRLGVAGGVLAALMTVLAYIVTVDAARRGSTIPGLTPQAFMVIPFATVLVFPSLVGAALVLRRRTDFHKRLMLIATTELLVAGVARIPAIGALGPVVFFAVTDLFVVALAVYDLLTLRRIHPATLCGGAFLIGSQLGRIGIATTDPWLLFAGWMTST